jgi:hypothetical protein
VYWRVKVREIIIKKNPYIVVIGEGQEGSYNREDIHVYKSYIYR